MNKENKDIPPPPEKPEPNECCGSGCVPCIYDYYYEALEKWEAQFGEHNKNTDKLKQTNQTQV